ncbi:1-(5-phosphoribosyl)-5-[(5-phosphoribosylamino)methylideneamino]imidazole-4-carboxamide isomerase [Clostridium sp. DL1XJH146]
MIVLPAIDLKNGKPVRLYKGDFATSQIVADSAIETAIKFKEDGAEYLHVVDLDGALEGNLKNIDVVSEIIKSIDMPIELGGGIRDLKKIDLLVNKGISRVILGTAALKNPDLVKESVKEFGDKIAVGIDAKDGFVATAGWIDVSKINYIEFAKRVEDFGVKTIIYTDISKDGTLEGQDLVGLEKLKNSVVCNIIASGGVKDIEDIRKVKEMNLYGVIAGKSIYSKTLDLKEAIKLSRE